MDNIYSLINKKILVSGASSGIGRVIAQKLAQQGACLTITGRNKERLQETLDSLGNNNHQAIIAELTKPDDLLRITSQIDKLDGVVFCAGIIDYMPAKNIELSVLDEIINVNFKSQIALYQNLHLNKKLNKKSSLVFISSISALAAVPGTLAYAASKAAITSSVRILASELSKQGIRVNSISPGLIETPLFKTSIIEKETFNSNSDKYPLG